MAAREMRIRADTLGLVFGRNKTGAESPADSASDAPSDAGKGRPTPTRKEAEAARAARAKSLADPKTARKLDKQKARVAQAKAREAMMAGDEKFLPQRDRGPVRRYARDWVDSRLSIGEFFLPAAIAVIVLGLLPIPALRNITINGWLVLTLLVVVDETVLGLRLRSALAKKFPDKAERKGATTYGALRGLQMRGLRVPKPRVRRGQRP
jgi:hypothetical protein